MAISKSLDKLLLTITLVALIGSGAIVALQVVNPPQTPSTGPQVGASPEALHLAKYRPAPVNPVATNGVPTAWVSETRVQCDNVSFHKVYIKPGATTCPFCGVDQKDENTSDDDRDGIYNSVEDQYGLDKFDPSDAYADLDGDSYTNLEEVGMDVERPTDPNDAASHPPYADDLCLSGTRERPFNILFSGVTRLTETNLVFNLQFKTLGDTWFAQIGEDKHGYRLLEYTEKLEEVEQGQILNKSTVTIEVLASGEKIDLPFNKEINNSRRLAKVVFVRDPQVTIPVLKKDTVFKVREEEYTVLAIAADRLRMKRSSDGKLLTISACSPDQEKEYTARQTGSWVPGGGFMDDEGLEGEGSGRFLPDGRRPLRPGERDRLQGTAPLRPPIR